MDAFNVVAGVVLVRNLAEELHLACIRAEQLPDYLSTHRDQEASLRIGELTSTLSELPHRRGAYLSDDDRNRILTCRQQLASITDALLIASDGNSFDTQQGVRVANRVATALREILGGVRAKIETGASNV